MFFLRCFLVFLCLFNMKKVSSNALVESFRSDIQLKLNINNFHLLDDNYFSEMNVVFFKKFDTLKQILILNLKNSGEIKSDFACYYRYGSVIFSSGFFCNYKNIKCFEFLCDNFLYKHGIFLRVNLFFDRFFYNACILFSDITCSKAYYVFDAKYFFENYPFSQSCLDMFIVHSTNRRISFGNNMNVFSAYINFYLSRKYRYVVNMKSSCVSGFSVSKELLNMNASFRYCNYCFVRKDRLMFHFCSYCFKVQKELRKNLFLSLKYNYLYANSQDISCNSTHRCACKVIYFYDRLRASLSYVQDFNCNVNFHFFSFMLTFDI